MGLRGTYPHAVEYSSITLQPALCIRGCCCRTVVLEKTAGSPSDSKEIKPVTPKGNQSWIFIGRNDAKAEAPILWPPDGESQLIGKDLDAGKDWKQEEERAWDGWMASPMEWSWTWANSGRWWGTGRPGVLQTMGSQRVRHGLATEQQPPELWDNKFLLF